MRFFGFISSSVPQPYGPIVAVVRRYCSKISYHREAPVRLCGLGQDEEGQAVKTRFEKAGLSWFVVVGGDFKLPEANEYDGLYEGGLML